MKKKVVNNAWRTMVEYYVEGITKETDDEILAFCGGIFGGDVIRKQNGTAFVTAYID